MRCLRRMLGGMNVFCIEYLVRNLEVVRVKVRDWGEMVERRAPGIALVFGYSLLAADKGILDKKQDDDCHALAALAGIRNRGATSF